MSENLNWIDRLRQSFENFEPKVERKLECHAEAFGRFRLFCL